MRISRDDEIICSLASDERVIEVRLNGGFQFLKLTPVFYGVILPRFICQGLGRPKDPPKGDGAKDSLRLERLKPGVCTFMTESVES